MSSPRARVDRDDCGSRDCAPATHRGQAPERRRRDFGQLRSRRLQIRPVDESRQEPSVQGNRSSEFDGLLLELPKELSMATIAMRAFHRTYCEFESFEDAGQGSAAEEACDVADTSAPNEPTEVDASLNVPQGATEEASAEEPAMEEAEKENAAPAQTETTETDPAETKPEEEGGETKPTEDESGEEAPVEEAPVESEAEPVVAETKPLGPVESIGGILTLDLLTLPPLPRWPTIGPYAR